MGRPSVAALPPPAIVLRRAPGGHGGPPYTEVLGRPQTSRAPGKASAPDDRSRAGRRARSKGSTSSGGVRQGRPLRAVDPDVLGGAAGERFLAALHFVDEAQAAALVFLEPADHLHGVAVFGAASEAAFRPGDHQEVALFFDVGVVEAGVQTEPGARHLEPDHVDRVVNHSHLVGLGVAHLDVDDGRRTLAPGGLRLAFGGCRQPPPFSFSSASFLLLAASLNFLLILSARS